MKFSLAPMEGIITVSFRKAYWDVYGEADEYYTPFLTSPGLGYKEMNEILPEKNPANPLIPQILTNIPETFLSICDTLTEYDYKTVNLNLGCPSGTVVSKKRGAGFLTVPDKLDEFLYEIYDKSKMEISIKTRIGFSSADEWPALLEIFNKYPVKELIIHPRTRLDYYNDTRHLECVRYAIDNTRIPICYNGDITDIASLDKFKESFPEIDKVMIGRGILKNPGLMGELKNNTTSDKNKIIQFHDELFDIYKNIMSGEKPVLFKMKEIWGFLSESFPDYPDCKKKVQKTKNLTDYKIQVKEIFKTI